MTKYDPIFESPFYMHEYFSQSWFFVWLVSSLQATEITAIESKMDVSQSLSSSSYFVAEHRKSDTARQHLRDFWRFGS